MELVVTSTIQNSTGSLPLTYTSVLQQNMSLELASAAAKIQP